MTKRPRRNHGAAFKAKVALEAIKGEQTYWWMIGYNEERPHYALGHMTPVEYMEQYAENSTLKVST